MSPRFASAVRRSSCGLALGGLAALVPKCALCLAAYAGLGAALGVGSREFCGAAEGSSHLGLVIASGAAGVVAWGTSLWRRRPRA